MPTEPELLRAVLSNPDSDAARLAYAGWCGQQRDEPTKARGEFIRAQIAGATATRPLDAVFARQDADLLLETYQTFWSEGFSSPAVLIQFDRGFVECVILSARDFLARASALYAVAPIRHLDLTGVPAIAKDLFSSQYLLPIRSLRIDRDGLVDDDLIALASSACMPELRWLSLVGNKIGFDGIEALAASKHFSTLKFAEFRDNLVDPAEGFSHDNGYVVDRWMPKAGEQLEAKHGVVPWLHRPLPTLDQTPDRFRI